MPTIQITQHNRHRPLLENIRDYLGDGSLKPSDKELKKKGVHTMEDLKKYGGKTDYKINSAPAVQERIGARLTKFNLYSRKGEKFKLLREIVGIYYTHKVHGSKNIRIEKMTPLVEELQRKILVGPNSPYRQIPKLEEVEVANPESINDLDEKTLE